MASHRLIDKTPSKGRARNIEVLVFGFSRTGTMSLKVALEKLGYSVYHMSEALKNTRNGHLTFWQEALDAKFHGEGKTFGEEEFDKFLGDYNVLEDIPSIMFVDELVAAYPSAKVILTNRDVDSWQKSMNGTFYTVTKWRTMPYWAKYDKVFWGPYMSILRTILTHWGAGDPDDRLALRHTYINHYAHVRNIIPKDRLLDFESKDGWEPLCNFLGKDVPAEDYPRVNDAASTVRLHGFLIYLRIFRLIQRPLIVGSAVGVAWLAWLGYKRLGSA